MNECHAIFATQRAALKVASRLQSLLPQSALYATEALAAAAPGLDVIPSLAALLRRRAAPSLGTVVVGDLPQAVRGVTVLLAECNAAMPVVCLDVAGRFVACLTEGEPGRLLAQRVSAALSAQAVFVGGEPRQDLPRLSALGTEHGWSVEAAHNLEAAEAALASGQAVVCVQQAGETDFWPRSFTRPLNLRVVKDPVEAPDSEPLMAIGDTQALARLRQAVLFRPRTLIVGVGCPRHTCPSALERAVAAVLEDHALSPRSVKGLATLHEHADEPALCRLSERKGWPLYIFSRQELPAARPVGVLGIAEPACQLAAETSGTVVGETCIPADRGAIALAVARVAFARAAC